MPRILFIFWFSSNLTEKQEADSSNFKYPSLNAFVAAKSSAQIKESRCERNCAFVAAIACHTHIFCCTYFIKSEHTQVPVFLPLVSCFLFVLSYASCEVKKKKNNKTNCVFSLNCIVNSSFLVIHLFLVSPFHAAAWFACLFCKLNDCELGWVSAN